jgi:ribonuclease P protein subunit RPR2
MPKKNNIDKNVIKKIARTRMMFLFDKAHELFPTKPDLANRYVFLARKYAQRTKIVIPEEWKRRICHRCKKFLYTGINSRVRLHSNGKTSHVSVSCLECGKITRYYIKIKNLND